MGWWGDCARCQACGLAAELPMIPKPIQEITRADLQDLVGIARESRTLEFKLEMPGRAESESAPFLAGVSSLANTAGGDFVLGVAAQDGLAESILGISVANLDAEKLRLEQLLANGLEPRLPRIDIEAVQCTSNQYVFVLRVPRSWVGPHRVKANNRFYGRNSGGKYPLDVGELRTAFVLADSVAERVRAYRAERVARVQAGEMPVSLPSGGRTILHVIPFPPFVDRRDIDVVQSISMGTIVPLPLDGISGANQATVNLDGFVNYTAPGRGKASSYVQFFRNGAIEGVKALASDEQNRRPYISGPALTKTITFALRQYLDVLRFFEMGLPVFVFLSFTGMDGCTLRYSSGIGSGFSVAGPRRGTTIMLPEVTIESHTIDAPLKLKPIFNALWNAFGFLRCDMYDGQGVWLGDR